MSETSPPIEKKKDWRRPIVFEGVELPSSAIAIDHLGMYGNLPDMSEPTSEFLWRFTICVGRPLTVESEVVIRHCSEALALTENSKDRLILTVPAHWDGPFDSSVVDEWISTLRTIVGIAAKQSQCTWEAPLRPDEPNYGRPLAEVQSEMLGRMQKCFDRAHKRPWWKRLFS